MTAEQLDETEEWARSRFAGEDLDSMLIEIARLRGELRESLMSKKLYKVVTTSTMFVMAYDLEEAEARCMEAARNELYAITCYAEEEVLQENKASLTAEELSFYAYCQEPPGLRTVKEILNG
jgi:hypothetical protein